MAFTYFFRDLQTLELILQYLIPIVSGRSSISIWDAGCASGEEPYSFAILLAEKMGNFAFKNVRIYATDIDISNQFAKIIKEGKYPYGQLQRIPKELFSKYFISTNSGDIYQIIDNIRNRMIYIRDDLLKYKPPSRDLSLVICKNVLLHFEYTQRIKVLRMFHQSLAPRGLLAMEHTQKMPEEISDLFTPVVNNAQLYMKK